MMPKKKTDPRLPVGLEWIGVICAGGIVLILLMKLILELYG